MRFSASCALTAALSLASTSSAAKILLGNDDGFGASNIRELYRLLKGAGHEVVLVAPATDMSGQGGRAVFTNYANLTTPSEYNLIPAGAPSIGTDPKDSSIWYYNGTPAAVTFVSLDYVLPNFFPNFGTPDLFVSGPNFGTNLGPFLFTISGTIGSTYAAVERGIPGIAISASNANVGYQDITNTTNPSTWAAAAALKVVNQLLAATPKGQPVLPTGYGINVNIPTLNSSTIPPIYASRLTGEADVDKAVYNKTSGLFTYANLSPKAAGLNTPYNGDPELPGETYVVEGNGISVSVFTVDYDAPDIPYTSSVFNKFKPIFSNNTSYKHKREEAVEAFVKREPSV